MRKVLLFALVGALALSAGIYTAVQREDSALEKANAALGDLVGQPRPPWTLGAADGRRVSAHEFDGDVVLLNFWATWCAPCRAEMPMLVEVQRDYADRGFEVIGIALDDVQQARDFADELGVDYTILVGGADVMAAGVAYGNAAGMLPYSVLIDRDGIVRWTVLGELHRDDLAQRLEPLL